MRSNNFISTTTISIVILCFILISPLIPLLTQNWGTFQRSQSNQIRETTDLNFSVTEIDWGSPNITTFWQGCNTTFLLSWDDARYSDVNLLPVDEKYGISHTIFTTSYDAYPNRSYWRWCFLLDELFQGHDVQSHLGKHENLTNYSSSEQQALLQWGKTGIEELFGFTPIVLAYPYGETGGSQYLGNYFALGRTIADEGTSWPPVAWETAGVTISGDGIENDTLDQIVTYMQTIYHQPGYHVFKGYGHTNFPPASYGVSNFTKYEHVIAQIAGWPEVWYSTWGELTSYTIERIYMKISTPLYSSNKITFLVSSPNFDPTTYKIPVTISLLIPKDWDTPYPMIDGKYTSQFSIQEFADCKKIFLDVAPKTYTHNVTIWRERPIIDQGPPVLVNFRLWTEVVNQSWDQPPVLLDRTFMRFDVIDSLSNVFKVNASVYLTNGTIIDYINMQNPIFWQNSTYGRVLWNIYEWNVAHTVVMVQDAFGNTRYYDIYPNGTQLETMQVGGETLWHFPDKQSSAEYLISTPSHAIGQALIPTLTFIGVVIVFGFHRHYRRKSHQFFFSLFKIKI